MSFLIFPWWLTTLLAVAGASIPVIIHLLHRQRVQPVLWGAMQFLKMSPLQQKRRKKVEHWLLMLLRILLLVVLVVLLAWPRKDRKWWLLSASGGTDIAVVIDHSLSTGRRSGDATVFQKSVASVEQFARSGKLRASDSLSVVLAEHQPRKLTPVPLSAGSMDRLVSDLKRLKPGLSDAAIPDAVQAAREVLAHGRNARKVVVVLSDEQQAGWKAKDLTAWNAAVGQRVKGAESGLKVYAMPIVPDAQIANVSITDLKVAPAVLGAARPATITATILNSGSRDVPAHNARLLIAGKQMDLQPVPALSPDQSRTIHFEHTFSDPFSSWIQVQLDAADGLEADNAAVAATYVWPNIPVLLIDWEVGAAPAPSDSAGTADEAVALARFKNSRFLLNAMLADAADADAPALIRPTVISALDQRLAGLRLDDFAAVVVNDVPRLPQALMSRLFDYSRSGHGVWFIFGRNTDRAFIQNSPAQAGLFNVGIAGATPAAPSPPSRPDSPAATDAGVTPIVKDSANAMVEMFTTPEHNALNGVKTYRWWPLVSHSPDAATVLSAGGSDEPLVLERPVGSNGGRVVIWGTSVDGLWNNWPTMKMFPPLVNVTLHQLVAGQTRGMENRQLASGQSIVWTGPASPPVRRAEITLPDGSKVERRPIVRDGRQIITFDKTYLPGRYELRFDQSAIPQPIYYGVGLDRAELDPAGLTADDQKWLSSDEHKFIERRLDPGSELQSILSGGEDDQNTIWRWLACIVLVSLMVETWLTYRLIRRQAGPSVLADVEGHPMASVV